MTKSITSSMPLEISSAKPASSAFFQIEISVIAPMHNEEGNVTALYEDISRVLTALDQTYEIIFVNDVSTDGTLGRMKEIQRHDPRFHFVDLETNVGENWALLAGVSRAQGQVLVTIDGDYQNDPAYIPALLEKLSKGYRVVSGRRRQRVGKFWSRLLPSQIANGMIRTVSGVPVHDCGCGLKAYRRDVLEGRFVPTGFMNRFAPAALGIQAEEFSEVEVVDRPRISGASHYGLIRVFLVLRDLWALPFAVRDPRRWRRRFGWLQWLCLAAAFFLTIVRHEVLAAAAVLLALMAFSNFWNLGRFIQAPIKPKFRVKECR
jgi:glycosyltransferase involved in cell wall biosynthesis